MRIERLRETYDLDVAWVHFPLHPETPAGGQSLEDLFAGREGTHGARMTRDDLAAMKARLVDVAKQQGLPYGDRTMTYNSRLAQELGKWADGQDGGEAMHDALFRAYFVDGIDISDVEALIELAGKLDLDVAEAREVLETRRFRDAVDRDWRRSRDLGVTGVPTFVAGGYGVVGAQPYETLEQLVVKAGARRRS